MNTVFTEYVKEHITEYLPEEYSDSVAILETIINAPDDVSIAIIIPSRASGPGPRIYLDSIAEDVEHGLSLEDALREIAAMRTGADAPVKQYETLRSTLRTRLCDIQCNENYLMDKAWTKYGPFAQIYRVRAAEDPDSTTPVTQAMMEQWGVTLEQLREDAFIAERRTAEHRDDGYSSTHRVPFD